jgi:RNA polymerase sigma-70 factor, ECF subfamily
MSERHINSDQRLLLAAAQAGDEQAFRRLVEPYRHALEVHCYRMLGSAHDTEDLVQETLLRAWRALERFEPRAQRSATTARSRSPTVGR